MPVTSLEAFAAALDDTANERVQSASDWAPTVSIKSKKTDDGNYGIGYTILRWPFLVILSVWVSILLCGYSLARLYVSITEWLYVWRGQRKRLRQKLRGAKSYEEWRMWANELDHYLGLDMWRERYDSNLYDAETLRITIAQLQKLLPLIESDEIAAEEAVIIANACLKYNFAGTHNPALYSQCYLGTKDLVSKYNLLIRQTIEKLSSDHCPLSPLAKSVLFKSAQFNFGASALCLSGGGAFAYRHFGVVRALLKQDKLPKIISGTSGGGLVAAYVCTRTDGELREELKPDLADHINACWEKFPNWVFRMVRTGSRFDAIDWARRVRWWTMGDLTFKEAYERTGKTLNISTVPSNPNSPVILCNHITSPDCVIWSAVLASAAVPGILPPVCLLMKTKRGGFKPYSFGSRWKDGSLRTDIPTAALNTFFNVNFTIVSQVNPHIKLFAYLPRGQVGRPVIHKFSKSRWRGGFMFTAIESILKLEIQKCFRLLRDLDLIPRFLNQDWSHVFLQKFEGSVTVWPKIRLIDFWNILADPSREELSQMMDKGEMSIYPKLAMIGDFLSLEGRIASAVEKWASDSTHSRGSTPDPFNGKTYVEIRENPRFEISEKGLLPSSLSSKSLDLELAHPLLESPKSKKSRAKKSAK